ncbi:hypothetical protein BDZ91DRAFT_718582 [Kalaharituber pfeilii]|nr:hypothetical protein BDZ91DRAFT_718582 [Kalaharituber pfeilii]
MYLCERFSLLCIPSLCSLWLGNRRSFNLSTAKVSALLVPSIDCDHVEEQTVM